jgi:hypothetical protein
VQRLRELVRGFGYSIEYQMTGPKEPGTRKRALCCFDWFAGGRLRASLTRLAQLTRGPRQVNQHDRTLWFPGLR